MVVRIPTALAMPCTSSGEVSWRTRMTWRPCSAAATAASGVVTISPQARPGEAPRPRVMATASARLSAAARGGSASRWATRCTASARDRGKSGSSAISTAMRTAAWGLRLPTRVCSIHSLPRSMVNSMSQTSV